MSGRYRASLRTVAGVMRLVDVGDRAGIGIALACAVHCVATPLLAASVQIAGVFAAPATEWLFMASSLLVSAATIVASCLRGGAPSPAWRAVCGLFAVGASLLLWARVGGGHASIERPFVIGGATLIVAAHVINLVYCQCANGRSCD